MNAEKFNELLPDYVVGKLSHEQLEVFNAYLISNPEALESVQDWTVLKNGLDSLETEPSKNMDTTFSAFLQDAIAQETEPNYTWFQKLFSFKQTNKFVMPLATMSLVLVAGFVLGNFWNGTFQKKDSEKFADTQINQYKIETEAVRTQLVMSLVNEPSANKRLQAATEATKLDHATEKVILALFKMLNTDANVNVRLAAVTSLSKYVDNPKVREGLILSITQQESPLVQIALADLMVTLKEEKSINSFEQLLERPDLNSAVKLKLERSINQII